MNFLISEAKYLFFFISVGNFFTKYRGWKVKLVVNNDLKDVESSNVIGIIEGELEPDRYVIIGE
jgi:hypothetical protein